jgi:hypothetical protein
LGSAVIVTANALDEALAAGEGEGDGDAVAFGLPVGAGVSGGTFSLSTHPNPLFSGHVKPRAASLNANDCDAIAELCVEAAGLLLALAAGAPCVPEGIVLGICGPEL